MLMDGIQLADLLLITPSCPARFRNIPHMSFDDTAKEPEQTFSLSRDPLGELEYPTKYETDPGVWGLLLPATAALSSLPDLGKSQHRAMPQSCPQEDLPPQLCPAL